MAEIRYKKNPFQEDVITHTVKGVSTIYATLEGKENTFAAVNRGTGEDFGDIAFGKRITVDKTYFLKMYANGIRMFLNLKSPGIKVFMIIFDMFMSKDGYQKDYVILLYDLLDTSVRKQVSRSTFYSGIRELKKANFLAPAIVKGMYWINCDYVFRGNRLTLVNQYILEDTKESKENLHSCKKNDILPVQ